MTKKAKRLENKDVTKLTTPHNNSPHLYSMGKKYYIHPNDYLTAEQVEKLFTGCERAYALGCPLNRFITIHYDDYADIKRPQKFVTGILEHSRKWLQRRGLPVAYIYVLENGKYKGIHTHILIHIPPNYQIEYKKALKRWLPFEGTNTRINVKTVKHPHYGNLSPLNSVYGILRYMGKGVNPKSPVRDIEPLYQGKIYGQRFGISLLLKQ